MKEKTMSIKLQRSTAAIILLVTVLFGWGCPKRKVATAVTPPPAVEEKSPPTEEQKQQIDWETVIRLAKQRGRNVAAAIIEGLTNIDRMIENQSIDAELGRQIRKWLVAAQKSVDS